MAHIQINHIQAYSSRHTFGCIGDQHSTHTCKNKRLTSNNSRAFQTNTITKHSSKKKYKFYTHTSSSIYECTSTRIPIHLLFVETCETLKGSTFELCLKFGVIISRQTVCLLTSYSQQRTHWSSAVSTTTPTTNSAPEHILSGF